VTVIDETLPVAELAAVVSEALESAGLDAVLSGGSVVTIYSDNEYESFDLDFVTTERMNRIEDAMASIGYQRASGRHFEHPSSRYLVEFPAGPLSVGDEVLRDTGRVTTLVGTIRLLTPTQCVMDRLASYYHWHDPQGLEQALMVAMRQVVDLEGLQSWSVREGNTADFEQFKRRLDASRRP
jgi:hypothetical protein